MLSKEEEKQAKEFAKEERKIQRAKSIAHLRGFKNFWWWFFGFMSSFIICGSAAAICICVLPMSTYVGKDGKYVDSETADNTLLQFLMNYKDYSVSNFPALKKALKKLVEAAGLDKYVEVDYDKLAEALSFDVSNISFKDIYKNCVDVICTIDSLGLSSLLGDFANLSIMNESTVVEGTIDTSSESFKPYMYYYLNDNDVLKRAYDDEGNLLEEAQGKQLYYPALRKIPVDELINVLPKRLGQEKVLNVLGIFTDIDANSIFKKLFDEYTIEGIGSFDVNNVLVSDILSITDENRTMFEILCSAVKISEGEDKPTPETLSIGSLSSIDIKQIHIVDIVEPNENNEDLYTLLRDVTGKENNEDITVGDAMEAHVDDVKFSSLLSYSGNEQLGDILVSITGKSSYEEIYFSDLKNIDTNKIKLSTVISNLDEKLQKILCKGCGVSSYDDLIVGNLSTFDINAVLINDVMPDLSDKLKEILVNGTGASSYETLTFSDLNEFDMNKLSLSLIIENNSTNSKLISILLEATGKDNYDELNVGNISCGFNIDNVRLETLMGSNDTLFDILSEATGIAKDQIKIGDLSSFSFDNVKLSSVIKEETGNRILDTLLKDDSITISNLGEKINNMAIYEFYGEDCFTQDETKSSFTSDHYVKGIDASGLVTFTLDTDGDYTGDYYVSNESGILTLLCYTVTDTDANNGRANQYTQSSYKYTDLENNENTNNIISDSTIYQLISAGLLADKSDGGYSDKVKKLTVQQVIDMASSLPDA